MDSQAVITLLRHHEPDLRAAGIDRLTLIGSVARGESGAASDIDLSVRLAARGRGLAYFGQIERLRNRLEQMLGNPIDMIVEPVTAERLAQNIRRDEIIAFE